MPKGVYDRSKAKKAPEAKAAPAKRGRKPRAEAASSATLTLSGREITVSIDAAGTVSVSVGTP